MLGDHDIGEGSLESTEVSLLEIGVALDASFDIERAHVLIKVSLTVVESLEEVNKLGLRETVSAVWIFEVGLGIL